MSRVRASGPLLVAVACGLLALASLLVPSAPVYDSWAWLVWGRELVALELDTAVGPSWKPLPVLVDAALSPAGSGAPDLWLAIARAAWLGSIALAWRLAARLAPPASRRGVQISAGGVAALSLLLLAEPQTPWLRHFAHGLSEPLLVLLVLGALDRHLSRRRGQVLALLLGASLLRPEAWPFLAAYALLAWRSSPAVRPGAAAALAAVPLLWLGGEWLGSGAPLTGGERARGGDFVASPAELLDRMATVVELALTLPSAPVWAAAAAAAVLAARGGERTPAGVLLAALAWIGIVLVEVLAGFAPLARFLLPGAALACVLGGAGVAWLLAHAERPPTPWPRVGPGARLGVSVSLVVLALAAIPYAVIRVADLVPAYELARENALRHDRMAAAVAAAGPAAVGRCGDVAVESFLLAPGLAWELELPLGAVASAPATGRVEAGALVASAASGLPDRVEARRAEARRVAAAEGWVVVLLPCPGAQRRAASGSAIAGVSGARP